MVTQNTYIHLVQTKVRKGFGKKQLEYDFNLIDKNEKKLLTVTGKMKKFVIMLMIVRPKKLKMVNFYV